MSSTDRPGADSEAAKKAALIFATMDQWLSGEPVWPLERVLERWGPEFRTYRSQLALHSLDSGMITAAFERRDDFIKRYGFAIPCAELLEGAAKLAPLVEIGAGSGYLTALMRKNGIDVIGSDPCLDCERTLAHRKFDPDQQALGGKTAVRRWRDRNVFCSWPRLETAWFRQAMKAMQVGARVLMIMESSCARGSAHDYIEQCFEREGDLIEIPAWPFLNDYAEVRVKKRNRWKRMGFEERQPDCEPS
jgi:hypothetical protein